MSFRLKTILGIALIESVLLLVLVLSSLDFLRTSNEEQLVQRATTTSKLFASATKDAVLATDLATLESFVDEMLSNPEVVYVRIRGGDLVLAQGGRPEVLTEPRELDSGLDTVSDGVFDVQARIEEAGITYGVIELGLSTRSIQGVFSEAGQWATGIAVLEVLLVAVFSFILGSYLTRHLRQLQVASKTITDSGPGHQLSVTGRDEIADVAKAFNAMSTSLQRTYAELQDSLESRDRMLENQERNRLKNQAILSASLDVIITIDHNGMVVDFNDAAERTFGWTFDEIAGKNMANHIIPPELREAHERGMRHYLASGEGPVLGSRIQLQAQHRDGQRFPVEVAICPIDTPEGPLFTAFLRDISQHIADQTEMRLAARAFETSEAMFITDADACIIRVNRAITRISGYQEHEILGRKASVLASGRHDADFYKRMWASLLQDGEWKGEIQNRRKDGEIFPEYLNISAVHDDQGSITHYVAHLVDISDQKAKEQQLRMASQKARQADEAKGRFLAVMSHEIRTPMNAVLGILGLLRDTPLNAEQKELIRTGRESGELLLSIINDILDFSKMEADKLELEHSAFDLHQMLAQSMELLRSRAEQKGLALILHLGDDLPRYVRGDACRLRQVLVNLINNAVKFTNSGNITVLTSAVASREYSFELHCEVQDTGIGIPREKQNGLFDEFAMVDQSHSRAYEGTGLGLAISKRLVFLMGGQIGVESQPGIGSRFFFHVELKTAGAEEVKRTGDQESLPLPNPDSRILLAEDNPANQKVIRAILQGAGLQVDIVNNGQEAVEALGKLPYDIVLMDISMPRMDGMEATRAIRAMAGAISKIPIVALTAHALTGDRERFLANGMNDYLTKPTDKAATLRCISYWTGGSANQVQNNVTTNTQAPSDSADAQAGYVDEAVLLQLVRDTSAAIVPELLLGYIEDARVQLRQIEQALNETDAEKLEFEVHTLGSSAAAHGNPALHQLARHIEGLCREGLPEQAFDQTAPLFELAEESLRRLARHAESGFGP